MFSKEKFGFSLVFASGHRAEIDFGPMSQSENKNVSKKEFEVRSQARNAEIRLFNKNGEMVANEAYQSVDQVIDLCNRVAVLYKED
jgi:hypothetical protein